MTILAFSLGGPEMIVVFLVVLLLFGAKKLPELARGMGKSMGEFKKAREDFEHEITRAETDAYNEDEDHGSGGSLTSGDGESADDVNRD